MPYTPFKSDEKSRTATAPKGVTNYWVWTPPPVTYEELAGHDKEIADAVIDTLRRLRDAGKRKRPFARASTKRQTGAEKGDERQ
jgi:hypothetical protein